jgi:hypothetical protein
MGNYHPLRGSKFFLLEVLDRRIFTAELIEGQKERY